MASSATLTAFDTAYSLGNASYTSLPALLSVVSAVAMGVGVSTKYFFPHLSIVECVAAGPPVGLTLAAWVSIFLKSFVFQQADGLTPTMAWVGVVVQTLVALWAFNAVRASWGLRQSKFVWASIRALWTPILLLTLTSIWFSYMHYTHSLGRWGDQYFVGGTVYGDMPFHLNVINSLLFGANQHASPATTAMEATFYMDHGLVYPFLPDYHAASLVGAGAAYHFAFFVPGTLLCASFLFLLFALNLRLTGSVKSAMMAVPLTLFAGGVGGFIWLLQDGTWWGMRSKDHVLYHVGAGDSNSAWFSLTAHILFPQRTTQFAYPISLLALILCYRALESHGSTEMQARHAAASSNVDSNPASNGGGDPFMTPDRKRKPRKERTPAPDTPSLLKGQTNTVAKAGGLAPMPMDVTWLNVGPADRNQLLIAAGVVTGMLPLLQAHSFVAVGLIMIVVALMEVIQLAKTALTASKPNTSNSAKVSGASDKQAPFAPWADFGASLKSWIIYGVAAFSVGIPQSIIYFGKAAGGQKVTHPDGRITGFIRFVPLWHDQHESGPIALWWEALLYFVPLNIIGLYLLPLSSVQRRFQLGAFTVFLMANIVIFQPWELDNTKVFYIWVFPAAGVVAQMISRTYNAATHISTQNGMSVVGILMKLASVAAFLGLIFTGSLCMINETLSCDAMFDVIDVEQAKWLVEKTPIDARFTTSTHGTHFRPTSALAGRSLLTSYVGWVSNHGMPGWIQRNEHGNHLQEGINRGRAWQTVLDYNLTHIIFPTSESKRWDTNFLNSYAYRVASNGRHMVYEFPDREVFENPQDCAPSEQIDEESCIKRNCVWMAGFQGPWCQVKPVVAGYKKAGWEGEYTPTDCGHLYVTEQKCKLAGCSWVKGYDGPWCHEPVSTPNNNEHGRGGMPILTSDPVDCGGQSELSCKDRGCNWLPRPGSPWCTRPGSV